MKPFSPSLFLLAMILCASCHRREDPNLNWLEGRWIVDREKTTKVFLDESVAQLGISGETLKEKAAIAVAKTAAGGTISAAMKLLDKVEFTFQESEYRASAGDFGGEPMIYEILERPSRDQIKVRMRAKHHPDKTNKTETVSTDARSEAPEADSATEKENSGRIYTERLYHREGKMIWFESDFYLGKAKIYLKRKK